MEVVEVDEAMAVVAGDIITILEADVAVVAVVDVAETTKMITHHSVNASMLGLSNALMEVVWRFIPHIDSAVVFGKRFPNTYEMT